jgi:ribonuclease VapC
VRRVDQEARVSVLDASALIAHLNEEEGASVVRQAMAEGAAISVVNWAEVLTKLAERGEDPELASAELHAADLIGAAVSIEPVTDNDAVEIARLRPLTKGKGLSLADRACIALANRLQAAVVTADRAWSELSALRVPVKLIR